MLPRVIPKTIYANLPAFWSFSFELTIPTPKNCKQNILVILVAKAISVQEPCVKCLTVHILKFEILQTNKKMKQKCSVFS